MDQTTGRVFDGTAAGFIGLAFQSIAQTGALPFWQTLVNSKLFTTPEMSFWLTRFLNNDNAKAAEPGGVLTLGGTNTTLYTGDIQFLDMPNSITQSYWLLPMKCACDCRISVVTATYFAA